MMGEVGCKVIEDLLTLYIDGLTSEESNGLIHQHISNCNQCKEYMEALKSDEISMPNGFDEEELAIVKKESKIMKSIKYRLLNIKIAYVVVGALLALFILREERALQSIIIYPLLGVASYGLIKKIWLPPIIVTVVFFIGSVVFLGEGMPIGIIAIICGVLTLIGTIMGYCIKKIWF